MRLFVAIELDAAVHAWCDQWRASVVAVRPEALRELRWVDASARHVTMKFIGEVEPARATAIAGAVSALRLEPVEPLVAAGLRWLPQPRRARVLALDIAAADSERHPADARAEHPLAPVHRQLEVVLVPFGVGADTRAFTPHVTLARVRQEGPTPWAAPTAAAASARVSSPPPGIAVGRLALFESRLRPEGPEYHLLAATWKEEGT
jgi:RNA 2',3'-cyclic 3'-phosphodiesterase